MSKLDSGMETIKPADMNPGDIVRMCGDVANPFMDMLVASVDDVRGSSKFAQVHLVRPWLHNISYITVGFERFDIWRDSEMQWFRLRTGETL